MADHKAEVNIEGEGGVAGATTSSVGRGEGPRQLRCEVFTPTGTVFEGNLRTVIAPGVMGEMGILPLHAPLMTPLRIGELRLKPNDQTEILYAIGGGFLEVRDDRVIILTPSCEAASDVDVERAEAAKGRAEKVIAEGGGEDEADMDRMKAGLDRAVNRLSVAAKN